MPINVSIHKDFSLNKTFDVQSNQHLIPAMSNPQGPTSVFLHYLQLPTRRSSAVINYEYRLSGCYSHYFTPATFKSLKQRQRYGTNHIRSPAINTAIWAQRYRHVHTIQSGQGGKRIDHFGNINGDENWGSGVNVPLLISGWLSQTWTILINSDSIWIQFNGSRNSKTPAGLWGAVCLPVRNRRGSMAGRFGCKIPDEENKKQKHSLSIRT